MLEQQKGFALQEKHICHYIICKMPKWVCFCGWENPWNPMKNMFLSLISSVVSSLKSSGGCQYVDYKLRM